MKEQNVMTQEECFHRSSLGRGPTCFALPLAPQPEPLWQGLKGSPSGFHEPASASVHARLARTRDLPHGSGGPQAVRQAVFSVPLALTAPAGEHHRILLVDDDSILLDNLKRLLLAERSQWEVRTTTTGAEAVRLLKSEPMDLLVADIQMPGMDGLALLAEVRRDPALARLPVIFMTARDDRTSFREGMSSGADDYLPKPFSIEELIQAMEARLKRQAQESSPPRDDQALFDELANTLTGRELEVLALIGHGLVTKDIAATLKVSYRTVSVHRTNIMRKLNLHNAAALAALANKASMA